MWKRSLSRDHMSEQTRAELDFILPRFVPPMFLLIISLSAGRPQATGLASLLLLPRRPRRHPLVATPPASAGVSWLQSNASRPTPHPHQAPHPTNRDRAADASRLQRPGPDDHHDHNDQDENAARISNCAITRTHTHTPKEHKQPSRIDRCSDSVREEAKDGEASGCWLLAAGCWLLAHRIARPSPRAGCHSHRRG